jgi:nicotinate-nucleotide pyrophosphorylase (carboxylating)
MHTVDPRIAFHPLIDDGRPITPGELLAEMHGPARSLLFAERTALNFLSDYPALRQQQPPM